MSYLSDSEFAFRLQLEEAISASLSSQSSSVPLPPPTPVVHRCGIAIVLEDDLQSSEGVRGLNCGGELGKPPNGGVRNEKPYGKGNTSEEAIGVRGEDLKIKGKIRIDGNSAGCSNTGKPSPVILPQGLVRRENLSDEGCSKWKIKDNVMYRLYFKGLVSGDDQNTPLLAGCGIAVCDQADNVVFKMKGPLCNTGKSRQAAEIKALMAGLEATIDFGIKHIAIYCDYYPIYQYLSGRWVPKQKKIVLLVDDLQRLRQQLTFSKPVLVTRKDIKYAFKLAREAIVSQIDIPEGTCRLMAAQKETCVICFDETDAERMFSVDKCLHSFCFSCVNQYVEVKLLHGMIPKCPHDGCKSVLSMDNCGKILTPKLVEMWKKRIKEDSIPIIEKVYCPYPKCSALMSKIELSKSGESVLSVRPNNSGVRRCVECNRLFCINCKVPWHINLSCSDYKKLHPNPPADDVKLKSLANLNKWRQCIKCHHMIELSQGCYHITCRCGYEFCYNCGAEWNKIKNHCPSSCPLWNENILMPGNAANRVDLNVEDDEELDIYEDDYDYDDFLEDLMGIVHYGPNTTYFDYDEQFVGTIAHYPLDDIEDEEDWFDPNEEEEVVPGTMTVDALTNTVEDEQYLGEASDAFGGSDHHPWECHNDVDDDVFHHDPWECHNDDVFDHDPRDCHYDDDAIEEYHPYMDWW